MPELPEVETVRLGLEPKLINSKILSASLIDAKPHKKYKDIKLCEGQTIRAVKRRGKFLILKLSGDLDLIIHLGMTGVLSFEPFEKHSRVRLSFKDKNLYFQDVRRFGRFLVVPAGNYASMPTLEHMGPEPLSKDFNARQFYNALKKSQSAIKSYILSQKPVAGLGNIYVDESLWQAKIHPAKAANKIGKAKAKALVMIIKEILTAALKAQGTTLNDYRTVEGDSGEFATALQVYGRKGLACFRCGEPIERMVIAGRGTHFCAKCQKQS